MCTLYYCHPLLHYVGNQHLTSSALGQDRIKYQVAHQELRSYTRSCKLGCCLPQKGRSFGSANKVLSRIYEDNATVATNHLNQSK